MKLLIIGALGTVGRRLVPELVQLGHEVVISSRDSRKPVPWPELQCKRYTLDLLQPDSIPPALDGVEAIYYLMHGMSDGEQHTAKELWAARNLVHAAEKAGVQQILYLGSLLSDQPESAHLQARCATGRVLAASTLIVTELRAGIIIAPGSAAFEVMRDLVGHLPFILAPRSIHNVTPPIAIDDIIYYLVALLALPKKESQVLDAVGPNWLSYAQMMHRLSLKLKRHCKIITLWGLPVSWASLVLGITTSVPYSLAKSLVAGLAEPLQANPEPLQTLLPRSLMSYEQALDKVLAEEKIQTYPSRWQDGVPQFRNFSSLHGFYAKSARHTLSIPVAARYVWQVINRLGGDERYFFLNGIWALREWLDALFGGPGRDHGRTDANAFKVGDKVDSWTILSVEEERLLVLKFGMKAPGGGGMQIVIEPDSPASCTLSIELYWHPAGLWGLAYWYFFAPWHQLLLKGMCRNIKQLAWSLAHDVNLQEE